MKSVAWMDQAACANRPDFLDSPLDNQLGTCNLCPVYLHCHDAGLTAQQHADTWPPPTRRSGRPQGGPKGRPTGIYVDDIQHLADAGHGVQAIAHQLGCQPASIYRRCSRSGRLDLWRRIRDYIEPPIPGLLARPKRAS